MACIKRRRGAPRRVGATLTTRSSIRSTPAERADWGERAAAEGRDFGSWARRMIRIALGQPPDRKEDVP